MDVEVLDMEPRKIGNQGITNDEDAGTTNNGESSGILENQDEDGHAEPHIDMEFDSEDAAKIFYDEYARRMGFNTRIGQFSHLNSDGSLPIHEFLCSRDTCEAMLQIELKGDGKWVVTNFFKGHNHSTTCSGKVQYLRPRRHFAGASKIISETYPTVGTVPSGVMSVSEVPGAKPPLRRTLGKFSQNLLDYFKKMQAENPGFYYAIQLDEDNRMANVFWADARSRSAYSRFGDTVTLDTTFRVNQYRVPFAPFTGVNHHEQMIIFGCALLVDESEATFVWLLKTFLAAMNDQAPVSIVTDKDRAIQSAVSQVFPESHHCINKWDILREGQERLALVCHAHPNFQVDLYNCINTTETVEEFELSWDYILDKYDLRRNDWLQSLYNARTQWVPVYFKNSFFAGTSLHQGFQSSFFDGYVNQQTTLPVFFRQYERALEYSYEKEIEADYDSIYTTPVLRTPSPMEKQAATLFTRKIFSKFQEELVETFVYTANRIEGDATTSTYRVAKFEDDLKAYTVTVCGSETRASCSCQMFEYSGILCRHILTVFTVTNVLTLPSHYILKRWTRNAKFGPASDVHLELQTPQESLTSRYNILCKEAIKYAEEGATTPEAFSAALEALKEGAKKVAIAKKTVAKVTSPGSQVSAIGYDDKRGSSANQEMKPLLWPRQDEVTRHFNLNDVQSITDLNFPRMAPVSLQRDDGHSDNMVAMRCLKSMTWVMENKNSVPANRVAVINLKLQDTETTIGESEVKFQVSRDTLGAMLRSMVYIREQLSNAADIQSEPLSKRPRK
ncbi:protein FAR1-RELATED SEQUENCE 3-like isoform X2 [Impatiens glandulifera]|uniref:protein FAR1-RELATED SEQUENCE 3-like isoform X2 n=1 Tax=Impatiens glandulifera TaxID=253017 RepID=UPI001FB1A08D|nr:protein FAR1-RELATED SEQUENCE 3-like isoform X2 [Impatiens glandulifera]